MRYLVVKPLGRVRDPETGDFLQGESEVPDTPYWQRRIRFRDVEFIKEKSIKKEMKKEKISQESKKKKK